MPARPGNESSSIETRLPPEVYEMICSYACTDWGYTGRSLSVVSKYTRDRSAPFRYQCISLVNVFEVMSFSSVLAKTPARLRCIRHLFLCDTPQSSDPRWSGFQEDDSQSRRSSAANRAVVKVLKLVAPTVQTIHGLFIWPHTFCLLPSLDFPVLKDLALYYHYRSKPTDAMKLPNLRRLQLISCPALHKADFKWIMQLAPGLQDIYVTAAHPLYEMTYRDFPKTLEKVLSEGLLPKDVNVLLELPDLGEEDLVPDQEAYMDDIHRIATQYPNVSLVEPQPDIVTNRDAESKWMISIGA